MEKCNPCSGQVEKLSFKTIFLNKTMLISYLFLLLALYGIYEVFSERYFIASANAFDAGLHPGSREVAMAMKEAVFGNGGEVKRELPWSLYIVNYMYMIYVGSGIIFIVVLAKLFHFKEIMKCAAYFLTLGLGMLLAGLFTIMMDLNILSLHWMILSPQLGSGMWLMMPLYIVYIPLVVLEIYLLLKYKGDELKEVAWIILILSIVIEFVEFYIQAKLFDMNSARHLWTTYPILPFYFMLSSFVASLGIMSIHTYIKHKNNTLKLILERVTLYAIIALGAYEAIAYLFIDQKWAQIILFGDFKYYFYLYIIMTIVVPAALLFIRALNNFFKLLASISIILGTYLGKLIFVYGGNAYPMSDRFGTGFEKYSEYEQVKSVVFFMPSLGEIAIVVGSIGIILFTYTLIDRVILDKYLKNT